MGSWRLEAFRMGVYVSVPVLIYYIANSPRFLEDSVIEMKARIFPPLDAEGVRNLDELKLKCRKKKEVDIEKEFAKL